jgi:curli biogenesis system outer membrane secretion channel CsgG
LIPEGNWRSYMRWNTTQRSSLVLGLAGLLVAVLGSIAVWSKAPAPPIAIAVFDFELDDLTPASSYLHQSTSSAAALEKVTDSARRALTRSGRYRVIAATHPPATSAQPILLRDCAGCEAAMALQLGAEQSLIGVVRRATQTDYYIAIEIRDAHTGKLVDEQSANFAGSEEGWASGVRILLDHQLLYPDQPERLSTGP